MLSGFSTDPDHVPNISFLRKPTILDQELETKQVDTAALHEKGFNFYQRKTRFPRQDENKRNLRHSSS